jgi:hypothetical protein
VQATVVLLDQVVQGLDVVDGLLEHTDLADALALLETSFNVGHQLVILTSGFHFADWRGVMEIMARVSVSDNLY